MTSRHSEAAFETVIEARLRQNGYVSVDREGFDRERAIFPEMALAFIRETQPAEWAKLDALHGAKTGEQVLGDLCKWMDANGSLATLRHGFKCYGRTLRVAFFKAASYVSIGSIPGTPLTYASANDTSELVPVIRFA